MAGKVVNRRAALTGMGLVGAAFAASPMASANADEAMDSTRLIATTIADLRGPVTPVAGAVYYVTDPGQEGPFQFDRTDAKTADNTGLVLVSSNGHRFKRSFSGPIMIAWFGAKADYDPATGKGTANDAALDLALNSLEAFAQLSSLQVKFGGVAEKVDMPSIAFDAGNYLFTRKQHHPTFYTALMGLTLQGQGQFATNVHFNCPEDANGADNYFLLNDNRISNLHIDGMGFLGVTGSERFMLEESAQGIGGKTLFTDCMWSNWRVGFEVSEILGRTAGALRKFEFCTVRQPGEDSVFFHLDNPQAVVNTFIECDMWSYGTIFDVTAGGIVTVLAGSYITFNRGCLLNIQPESGGLGIGNGEFVFIGIKPEIRNASALVRMNAPPAHVVFRDCDLVVGQSQSSKNWTAGTNYKVGDQTRVGAGASPSLGRAFLCIQANTASADNQPLTGADWQAVWQPLHEIEIGAGSVHIDGGSFRYAAGMNYHNTSVGRARPKLMFTNCFLIDPLADSVDFIPNGTITNTAAIPRAIATGCQPYDGTDPVDVSLNAQLGFDGTIAPLNRLVFRASTVPGQGLPSAGDGNKTFLLPRGAHVVGIRLVTAEPTSTEDYKVTNFDGTVTFLPGQGNSGSQQADVWYSIQTEDQRTFVVSSTQAKPADGFILVEYM